MALLPPIFLDAVVALGVEVPKTPENSKGRHWLATGFFYGISAKKLGEDTGKFFPYLMTNRHVVTNKGEHVKTLLLRCNPQANEAAKEYPVALLDSKGTPLWYGHPNPVIDVVALPINLGVLQQQKMKIFFFEDEQHAAPTKKMREIGITEGDGVFALGFPMSLVGNKRNTVIVRAGTVARFSDALEEPAEPFLVDANIFPGNSGGPVVSRPEAIAISGTKAQDRAYLIGIVFANLSYPDIAISKQTGRPRIVFEENSGLAQVHTVDMIEEAIAQHIPVLRKMQQAASESKEKREAADLTEKSAARPEEPLDTTKPTVGTPAARKLSR